MNLISSTGYFGIFLLMFVENIFPPIPSEYIIPLAGFMVSQDKFSLIGVIVAGTLGSVLGALPFYYLGSRLGKERLKQFAGSYGKWLTLSPEDIEKATHWFDKHGTAAVLLCRLIPGIRSLISIPAGINKMSLLSFLFFTTIGSVIWTTILAYTGYFLGSNFRDVEKYFDPISYIVFGSIFIMYIRRLFKSRNQKSQSAV